MKSNESIANTCETAVTDTITDCNGLLKCFIFWACRLVQAAKSCELFETLCLTFCNLKCPGLASSYAITSNVLLQLESLCCIQIHSLLSFDHHFLLFYPIVFYSDFSFYCSIPQYGLSYQNFSYPSFLIFSHLTFFFLSLFFFHSNIYFK